MEDWGKLVQTIGIGSVVLLFVGYCIVYVGKRLLGKDDGLLTLLIGRLIAFVDQIHETSQATSEQVGSNLELQAKVLDVQVKQHEAANEIHRSVVRLEARHQPGGEFSNLHLHEAGIEACKVAEEVCKHLGIMDQTGESLRKLRDVLVACRQMHYEKKWQTDAEDRTLRTIKNETQH